MVLSLLRPRFSLWLGNLESASLMVSQEKKKKQREEKKKKEKYWSQVLIPLQLTTGTLLNLIAVNFHFSD